MKTFVKRSALACGVLMAALICMGIVYIDTVQNYWYVNGGFVKLVVSNRSDQAVMTVDTNTLRVGFNTNNTTRSFSVKGQTPTNNATGNGATASTTGSIVLSGGDGGGTLETTTASGGTGGSLNFAGGSGGLAPLATTNTTGGSGGAISLTAGSGASPSASFAATNAATGGAGANVTIGSGSGGAPAVNATNTVGGQGGNFTASASNGGTPSGGWSRKGGIGGSVQFISGNGGNGVRTNGGDGGALTFVAGNAGSATTGGNAGAAGSVSLTAGNGSSGATNSDGGNVYLRGGTPGSAAIPGNIIVGRTSGGIGNGGGLVVGISNSATLTNVMFVRTNLDFGNIAAQSSEDRVAFVVDGRTNAIVTVGAPPSAMAAACNYSGWMSNGTVYVRFNNFSAGAIDPGISDFDVEVKCYR